MINTNNPEIDVEDIMRRIREEVARRKTQMNISSQPADMTAQANPMSTDETFVPEPVSLSRMAEGGEALPHKKVYTLSDFLNFHDEAFVRNAYYGILRREPDSGGFTHYLTALREGRFTKIEILGHIRFSPEGKTQMVQVKGLRLSLAIRTICRLPVLGYLIALGNFLLRLPLVVRNWERFEAYTLYGQQEQRRQINVLASQVETAFHRVQQRISERDALSTRRIADAMIELSQLIACKASQDDLQRLLQEFAVLQQSAALRGEVGPQLESMVKALEVKAEKEQLTRLSDQLVSLVENKAEALRGEAKVVASKLQEISQQMLDHKRSILDQQRRLTLLLEEARKRLPEPISGEEIGNMLTEEDHLLDAFYVSFEDRFRGTCEDIKKRVEVYLPLISEANAGTKKTSILDIGCGRGEWLELLKENKLVARGVDTNRIMVSHCKELGLDVEEADAITYLRSLKKNSLGAVTGIHIIEHIPFKRLVALFDETLRVLKPGGVAIFETPNPENLVVGACNFYCDPTHLSPWMPEMIRFVSESRGFSRVEIKRLHPNSDGLQLIGGEENVKTIINKMLFGPQDFAVIAYKGMSMDETAFQQPPKERSL